MCTGISLRYLANVPQSFAGGIGAFFVGSLYARFESATWHLSKWSRAPANHML